MNSRDFTNTPRPSLIEKSDVERVDGFSTLLASGQVLSWRSLEGVSSSALSERSYLTLELADAIRASYRIKAPIWGNAWMSVLCGLDRVARLNARQEVKLPCTCLASFSLARTLLSVSEISHHEGSNSERVYLFALASAPPTP